MRNASKFIVLSAAVALTGCGVSQKYTFLNATNKNVTIVISPGMGEITLAPDKQETREVSFNAKDAGFFDKVMESFESAPKNPKYTLSLVQEDPGVAISPSELKYTDKALVVTIKETVAPPAVALDRAAVRFMTYQTPEGLGVVALVPEEGKLSLYAVNPQAKEPKLIGTLDTDPIRGARSAGDFQLATRQKGKLIKYKIQGDVLKRGSDSRFEDDRALIGITYEDKYVTQDAAGIVYVQNDNGENEPMFDSSPVLLPSMLTLKGDTSRNYLAFVRDSAIKLVELKNPSGVTVCSLATAGKFSQIASLTWSPDGSRIAVVAKTEEGAWRILVADVDAQAEAGKVKLSAKNWQVVATKFDDAKYRDRFPMTDAPLIAFDGTTVYYTNRVNGKVGVYSDPVK